MAELADAHDSKSCGSDPMRVRFSPCPLSSTVASAKADIIYRSFSESGKEKTSAFSRSFFVYNLSIYFFYFVVRELIISPRIIFKVIAKGIASTTPTKPANLKPVSITTIIIIGLSPMMRPITCGTLT